MHTYAYMRQLTTKTTLVLVILGITILGIGFGIGKISSENSTTTGSEKYELSLLAKRIQIDNPSDTRLNFSPLRSQLNQYFEDNGIAGSLYFEYLPTGTSIRVNGDERYRAASLIKLPVAMELFKAQELGLLKLSDSVTLKEEWLNGGFGDLYQKGAGYTTTLEDLVTILLTDSDNTALRAIIEATSELGIEDRALGALDIEFNSDEDGVIFIGTRSYSSFLKCLYFSCYNTQEDSQQLLEILTKTPFNGRLAAGVDDENTLVAHKIGVFQETVQSDCGIVYLAQNNYVLCLMIETGNNSEADKYFSERSGLVVSFLKN